MAAAALARKGIAGRVSRERSQGAIDEQRMCGRQSRVVLTPRRWRQVSRRRAGPTGPGTPIREATVTTKPDHRGDHEGNRENHCVRECRVFPGEPRGDDTRVVSILLT
jgi:hypothetical protein